MAEGYGFAPVILVGQVICYSCMIVRDTKIVAAGRSNHVLDP